MFRPDGEVRTGLIDEIVHEIDLDRLIFEAPQRHQQIWFIERYGTDVNLGNIDPRDVISLETLRVGLRADTLLLLHGEPRRRDPPRAPRRDRRQRAAAARSWAGRDPPLNERGREQARALADAVRDRGLVARLVQPARAGARDGRDRRRRGRR